MTTKWTHNETSITAQDFEAMHAEDAAGKTSEWEVVKQDKDCEVYKQVKLVTQ